MTLLDMVFLYLFVYPATALQANLPGAVRHGRWRHRPPRRPHSP